MAVMAGTSGSVKIATDTVLEIDKWQLTHDYNLVATESFGDTWEEKSSTLGKFSGSFSGRLDTADTTGHVALRTAALAGTAVAVRLYVDGTHYYSGSVFVTPSIDAEVGNKIGASYSFVGTGALSYT